MESVLLQVIGTSPEIDAGENPRADLHGSRPWDTGANLRPRGPVGDLPIFISITYPLSVSGVHTHTDGLPIPVVRSVTFLSSSLSRIRSLPQEYSQTELPRLVAGGIPIDIRRACMCTDDGCKKEAQTLELLPSWRLHGAPNCVHLLVTSTQTFYVFFGIFRM